MSAKDLQHAEQAGAIVSATPEQVAVDAAAAIKSAARLLAADEAVREAPPYPVDALGPLADVCKAVAQHGQVQEAMAGQCLLGAASLLVQGVWNVESLEGNKPTSLNHLTLAGSGEGKSTAQRVALRPVMEWQRAAASRYESDLGDYERARSTRKKGDAPPDRPSPPFRVSSDATVEGLRRELTDGVASQGVFSDEAAAVLCGWGMSAEQKAKTGAVFAKLWDGGHLSVSRATGPRVERFGRRLALHWMIQPEAASAALGDPLLTQLGFWPRFLLAWPSPQEPRTAAPFRPEALPEVQAYWSRCTELLAIPLPDDADQCPALMLDPAARKLLEQKFESFETSARRGSLRPVKPFALRAIEQACRVAGVLAGFEGASSVRREHAEGALQLVAYSLTTWRAVLERGTGDDTTRNALALYRWLTTRPGWSAALPVILGRGPSAVRTKDARDAAIGVLSAAGLAATYEGQVTAVPCQEGAQ
jgi:hypothetical protein